MCLMDHEQRAMATGQRPEGFVTTSRRQHDAHIRHRGFGQYAGNAVVSEHLLELPDIVEFDGTSSLRRIIRRPDIPARETVVPTASRTANASSTVPW
jgi:hypothetical protein